MIRFIDQKKVLSLTVGQVIRFIDQTKGAQVIRFMDQKKGTFLDSLANNSFYGPEENDS